MNRKLDTIVVGVDTVRDRDPVSAQPGADPVLASAVQLAQRTGATLHVVHVIEKPDPLIAAQIPPVRDTVRLRADYVELVEQRLKQQVRRFPGYAVIRCRVLEGSAHLRLCSYAQEIGADLLVVGMTRGGRRWRNYLGSTAQRVLGRATTPVLVVRQPFSGEIRRILLATDLAAFSSVVHETGRDMIEALFDSEPLEFSSLFVRWHSTLLPPPSAPETLLSPAKEKLTAFLQARSRRETAAVEAKVRIGNPAAEIIHEAEEWSADLVVLGNHGPRERLPALLGSTATATLRRLPCNALVIPVGVAIRHERPVGSAAARTPAPAARYDRGRTPVLAAR